MFQKHKAAKLAEEEQRRLAEENRRVIEDLRARAAQLPDAEGVISLDAFHDFVQLGIDRHIEFSSIPDVLTALRLGLAQGGCFLETDTTLLLKKDERALLDAQVSLLKEVTDREFRGGSRGVSVPLGHGVRYRAGAMRGHMVTIGTHWATADTGVLTVTDQRVVYHGGRKTLEFAFGKLATLNVYTDAIDLGVTTRQSTSSFRAANPELVAGVIHGAINHLDSGVTIIRTS